MDFDIRQEIREIVHGLGEKKQRKDAMAVIQSVVFKQMALLVSQAYEINKKEITIKNVIFVLRKHKHTLIRMMRYYLFKENIHKLTTATDIEGPEEKYIVEQSAINEAKKIKMSNDLYKDIASTPTNFDFYETTNLDPISAFAKNYLSKTNRRLKKNSIFNSISNAIKELQLDISIISEKCIENATINTDARQIRINELATILSPTAYEVFQLCRRRNFQNKIGDLLLNKVHQALPIHVNYKGQVRDIFLYLAKESIACLIDRVYENRKNCITTEPKSINIPNENDSSEIKKREALAVDEIIAVITVTWNRSLDDINIPFNVNDTFLGSQLIFD